MFSALRAVRGLVRLWAVGAHKGDRVAVGEDKNVFKYPAEDECLVRRLGSAVIAAWPYLPGEVRDKLMAEAETAWDREYYVSQLPDKLEAIIRRAARLRRKLRRSEIARLRAGCRRPYDAERGQQHHHQADDGHRPDDGAHHRNARGIDRHIDEPRPEIELRAQRRWWRWSCAAARPAKPRPRNRRRSRGNCAKARWKRPAVLLTGGAGTSRGLRL